jgi:biofilm PGA synthesis N-glycosyltransferase PgaC
VAPLIQYPHVGAVTGNPRIRTRSTLIGRIQVGEFSSIIGLIKRTQRIYGRVFTVSGVIAAFRRQALADVGYWSPDMITEDIDISWKLQLRHWDIFRAAGAVLDPDAGDAQRPVETAPALGSGRRGGVSGQPSQGCALGASSHVAPVSGVRAVNAVGVRYAMTVLLFIISQVAPIPARLTVETLFPPAFTGLLLGVMCLLQFLVSLFIERRYERKVASSLFWVIGSRWCTG